MYCKNCGSSLNQGAAVCMSCGFAAGKGTKHCRKCGVEVNYGAAVCIQCGEAIGYTVNTSKPNPGTGLGIAAMVLGILSLLIPFGFIFAIVGLALGVVSKKKSIEAECPYGMATTGIVCSVIALAISIACIPLVWCPYFCAATGNAGRLW
jgi:hypothetical protein